MKKIVFFFSFIFSFILTRNLLGACLETRGALDIGSGSVKLIVASVDTCTQMLNEELVNRSIAVPAVNYLENNGQIFKDDFKKKLHDTINDLMVHASPFYIHKWRGVATEAYRKARNGPVFMREIEKLVGVPIQIISQEEEARLAVDAIYAKRPELKNNKNLVVWDIGGGSQQIIANNALYLGNLASSNFKQMVMKELNKKGLSPNPLGVPDALKVRELARTKAHSDTRPNILMMIAKASHLVYGIGGVHNNSLHKQLNIDSKNNSYNQKMLLRTLLLRAGLTDREIGGSYADTDITNIALVLGFMEAFDIREVVTVPVSLSHGVLFLP